jgi:ribosomal protein S18 acetylase RimI-like enzyme
VRIRQLDPATASERYVAEQDGRVVGLLVVQLPDLDNLHLGLLDLVVHPEFRRRGYDMQPLTIVTVKANEASPSVDR